MSDAQLNEPEEIVEVDAPRQDAPPQYGVGPFSLREVVLAGIWLVAFVVSFFPVTATIAGAIVDVRVSFASVWLSGLAWVLTIGVPTAAVFLLVLRRLSPDGIRRVGSLSVDQFASVAFSVSAVVWLGWVWETVVFAIDSGFWVRSWVMWVELVLMLAGVVLTVLAPFIPPFSEDFRHRAETTAHRAARPLRPVVARPVVERPAAAAPVGPDPADPYATGYATGAVDPYAYSGDPYAAQQPAATTDTSVFDASQTGEYGLPGDQTEWKPAHTRGTFEAPEPEPAPVRHQAFWALVPEERDIVDESGAPVFRIGPSAWALVIEDRGEVFVVRHEDGRVGYLHDVSGVTRG